MSYSVFAVLLVGSFLLYTTTTASGSLVATMLSSAAASAVVTMTVSVFWLWKKERVEALERLFGLVGHVPHCGYCLSLWLALFATAYFHIDIFAEGMHAALPSFLLSWWALGFLHILSFEILNVLWFKKLVYEFEIKKQYQVVQAQK